MENIFFDINRLKYLGENCIIGKTVRIRNPEECIIGDGTIIDDFTYISSEVEIGRNCHIATNVTISGGNGKLKVGDHSGIGAGTTVHCETSDFIKVRLDMPSTPKYIDTSNDIRNISIGKFILIGAHSCILPGASLPDGTAFGAYSLIKNINYESWTLYGGTKIKKICDRDLSLIENTDEYKKYYGN